MDAQIIEFVAEYVGISAKDITSDTRLFGDLGVDGDDGVELLSRFADRFSVNMAACDMSRHFGPEAGGSILLLFILALRNGTPEQKARLEPIRIADLGGAAKAGEWGRC
jgi:acyl carrier protein